MLQSKYLSDVSILKQVGDDFKITTVYALFNSGFEDSFKYVPKNSVNTFKLSNNITRAITTVREIGLCNDWEFFVTLTINKQYFDRYDLKSFRKVFSQWIRNYGKKHSLKISYLLIPEQHKDGAWHLHGFFSGLPRSHLHRFLPGDKMGKRIADKVLKGKIEYKWQAYEDKFGFNNIEPIRDKKRAVSYILKYISKDMGDTSHQLGAHLYYASKGLKRAQELKRGYLSEDLPVDFKNDYCRIYNLDGSEYSADHLKSILYTVSDCYAGRLKDDKHKFENQSSD